MKPLYALLLCVVCACSCTGKSHQPYVAHPLDTTTGVWEFRHQVLLYLPGMTMPLDGFMRYDMEQEQIDLAGTGPLGKMLFAMSIQPSSFTTHAIQPSLAKHPIVQEFIAQTVQSLWLDKQAALTRSMAICSENNTMISGWPECVEYVHPLFRATIYTIEAKKNQ